MRPSISFTLGAIVGIATTIAACSANSQSSTKPASNAEVVAPNDAARFSYGVGYGLGSETRAGITADGLPADWALVSRGFADAVNGRQAEIPKREFEGVLKAVHHEMLNRAAARQYESDPEFRTLADANAARSKQAIDAFAAKQGTRKLESGVYATTIASGSGAKITDSDVVIADWSMTRADGSVIDAHKRETIDPDALIPVASRTLRSMRVGDHWKVAFTPDVAFGLGGDAPAIGPNEAIFIDIKVLGTSKEGAK